MVLLEGSITGVETIPICVNAVVPEQPWTLTGTAVAPDGSRLFIHSAEVVPEFASKAYTVSFIVATYTTLCSPLLGMFTSGKYKGCPTTNPSTDFVNNFPKVLTFTLAGVSTFSVVFALVRALL